MDITNPPTAFGELNFGEAFAILEDAADGFVACDATGQIVFVNAAASQLCAQRQVNPLGQKVRLAQTPGVTPWDPSCDLGGAELERESRRVLSERLPGTIEYYNPRLKLWLEVRVSRVSGGGAALWFRNVTERKKLGEVLRETAEELRQAQRLAGVGSWTWDLETREITWSDELYRINGRDPALPAPSFEELRNFYSSESWQRLGLAVENTIRDGTPYELEVQMTSSDGRNCWRIVRGEAERDQSGRIVKLRGTAQDITDHKLYEEKLRLAHAELSAIHAHAPMVLLVVDEDLRVRKVNKAAAQLAGRDEADMLGLRPGDSLGCWNAQHSPNGCGTGPTCGQCTLRSAILDSILHRVRRDSVEAWLPVPGTERGAERCFLTFTAPLDLSNARQALVCAVDITDRKRAERALRDSEYWLNESQRVSRVGSYVLDCATGSWTISETLEEIFGIGPDYSRTVAGWQALVHPAQREEMTRHLEVDVLQHRKPFDREYRIVRPSDGQVRWLHGRGALVFDSEGRPRAMTGTIQDVTSRRAVEEELLQAQKLEGLGRLAGGIAHDFNNLLTVVNGYSDMLLRDKSYDGKLRESVGEIRRAGERAAGLTKQLLTFSRKQIIEPQPLELNRLIGDNLEMFRRLLGEGIEIETRLDGQLGNVMADPAQLHQVLMNLVVHAREAMPRGGKLQITTSRAEYEEPAGDSHHGLAPGRYALLSVADTGDGIPDEARENIFDPFFTPKGTLDGSGLGLASVHGIVRQAGGSISCHSETGRGTRFLVHLPSMEAADGKCVDADPSHPGLRGTETVLMVEDQDSVRKLAVQMLTDYGYRVLDASNGPEALAVAAAYQDPIHLLLTDVVMPGMTGRELAEHLMPLRPSMKVVFMSGYAEDIIANSGTLNPGLFFIAKPFTPESLALKLREVLKIFPGSTSKNVLVVDDESGVRALFGDVLSDAGYSVALAEDGEKALKLVRSQPFDVVLTDLVMPEKEGLEIIRTIRKEQPGLKIIAMSGAFGGEYLRAARILGADATLIKPVSPAQLVAAMREILA